MKNLSTTQQGGPAETWAAWTQRPGALDELCRALSNGSLLRDWAGAHHFDFHDVANWLLDDPARAAEYHRSQRNYALWLREDIIKLSDDSSQDLTTDENGKAVINHPHFQRNRIQIAARRCALRELRTPSRSTRDQNEKQTQNPQQDIRAQILKLGRSSKLSQPVYDPGPPPFPNPNPTLPAVAASAQSALGGPFASVAVQPNKVAKPEVSSPATQDAPRPEEGQNVGAVGLGQVMGRDCEADGRLEPHLSAQPTRAERVSRKGEELGRECKNDTPSSQSATDTPESPGLLARFVSAIHPVLSIFTSGKTSLVPDPSSVTSAPPIPFPVAAPTVASPSHPTPGDQPAKNHEQRTTNESAIRAPQSAMEGPATDVPAQACPSSETPGPVIHPRTGIEIPPEDLKALRRSWREYNQAKEAAAAGNMVGMASTPSPLAGSASASAASISASASVPRALGGEGAQRAGEGVPPITHPPSPIPSEVRPTTPDERPTPNNEQRTTDHSAIEPPGSPRTFPTYLAYAEALHEAGWVVGQPVPFPFHQGPKPPRPPKVSRFAKRPSPVTSASPSLTTNHQQQTTNQSANLAPQAMASADVQKIDWYKLLGVRRVGSFLAFFFLLLATAVANLHASIHSLSVPIEEKARVTRRVPLVSCHSSFVFIRANSWLTPRPEINRPRTTNNKQRTNPAQHSHRSRDAP